MNSVKALRIKYAPLSTPANVFVLTFPTIIMLRRSWIELDSGNLTENYVLGPKSGVPPTEMWFLSWEHASYIMLPKGESMLAPITSSIVGAYDSPLVFILCIKSLPSVSI